jgi:hypothetical protein
MEKRRKTSIAEYLIATMVKAHLINKIFANYRRCAGRLSK